MLRRYRTAILILTTASVLLLAYAAWWSVLADKTRTLLAQVPTALADGQGVTLEMHDAVVGGFPWSVDVKVSGLSVKIPSGTSVDTGPVTVSTYPWSPGEISLTSTSPWQLTPVGSPLYPTVTGDAITGRISLGTDGHPRQLSADFQAVTAQVKDITGPLKAQTATLTWTAPTTPPATAPAGSPIPQGQASLLIKDLDLPNEVPKPLKQRIDQLALSVELRGPVAEGTQAWRDAGGTLDIRSFRLLWTGLDLRANATLAFDAKMQPEGAGTVELAGAETLIDQIAAQNGLSPGQVAFAKAGLQTMTQHKDDGRDVLSTSVTLQDTKLSIGQVAVITVPHLSWSVQTQ